MQSHPSPTYEKAFLSVREVIALLNVSRATFYRLQAREELLRATHDFGPRSPRFERARILEFIETRRRR